MSILDDEISNAAGGADDQSIHDFMFKDRAVDAEVVDSGLNPEDQSTARAPDSEGVSEPVEKKKSGGFNIKWVFGGILAVGLVATVGKMVGGKPEEGVSEPVQMASASGEVATQTLPAELGAALEAAPPIGGDSAAPASNTEPKIAEVETPAPAMTAAPVEKSEKPADSNASTALQGKVAGLEKEVGNLKEQIAGLRQLVGDRNAIASYQQKVQRPRVSKQKVVSKPQNALPVAKASAAPMVAQASQPEPVLVQPAKRYTLRGIVYGQAAVERNGSLLYVREGDPLGETRVASIDPVAMEVRLANGVSIK